MFYWVDVIVFQFQYSKGVSFCSSLSGKTTSEAFNVIKGLVQAVSPADYGAYYLKNATYFMYKILYTGKSREQEEHGSIKVAHSLVISKLPVQLP